MTHEMWTFQPSAAENALALEGFHVEAADGSIGKVDEATNSTDGAYLVVDTGPWILGRKVVIPAGMVDRVDLTDEKVFVTLTKTEVKDSPELDESGLVDESYRSSLSNHYGTAFPNL
jgi:hypothetical protein